MRRAILLVCAVPLVMAVACPDPDPDVRKQIEITMRNRDALPVHMFLDYPSESFPCCQVASQGSRTKSYSMFRTGRLTFQAGRNGEILFDRTCFLNKAGYDAGKVTVVFTGNGLGCSGW